MRRYAGATAAIDAASHGGKVLIIEKAPIPGGISICAGGGIRITDQPEEALKYLRATNGGTTPDDVLETFAHGMSEIEDYVRGLAKINDAEISSYYVATTCMAHVMSGACTLDIVLFLEFDAIILDKMN